MKKRIIFALIAVLLVLVGILFFYLSANITGETIKEYSYSYTKAICNETNYCQDYEIKCEGNTTISQNPISGAVIQNPNNWRDPRDEESINKLCD